MNPQPPTPSMQENKTESFSVRPPELFEHSGSQLSVIVPEKRWEVNPNSPLSGGCLPLQSSVVVAPRSPCLHLSSPTCSPSHFCLPLLWLPKSPPPPQYSCPSTAGVELQPHTVVSHLSPSLVCPISVCLSHLLPGSFQQYLLGPNWSD